MDEFRKYQITFIEYQYEFYIRSESPREYFAKRLKELANADYIDRLYAEKFSEIPESRRTRSLIFEFDYFDTHEEKLSKLKEFCDTAKKSMKPRTSFIKGFPKGIPFDYVRKSNGDKENPKNMFSRWERLLKVFDLRATGLGYSDISRKMGNYKITDRENSIGEVKADLIAASDLISSAVAGRFPYPDDSDFDDSDILAILGPMFRPCPLTCESVEND